jgi:hypothetical protein
MDPGQPELLLIGYRNGLLTMKHFSMTSEGRPQGAKAMSQYTMGATPVVIKVDPLVSNVAFICCDSNLWRIEYDGLSYADPRIDRVWFTDPENVRTIYLYRFTLVLRISFHNKGHSALANGNPDQTSPASSTPHIGTPEWPPYN